MSRESTKSSLRKLRLSGMVETLDVRLQEAAGNRLSHEEFLELSLQDEVAIRRDRQIARRVKVAQFRETRSLEDFDWSFNPSLKRRQIEELATCRFIRERRDVLLLGPPGTGKSHVVQSLGMQAIRCGYEVLYRSIFDLIRDFLHDEAMSGIDKVLTKYLRPDLLIIDDMGMKALPKRSGEYLFEIIMRRYETRSTVMTSNRPLEDWGKLVGDVPAATAILDRFLHRAEVITITGRSYRMRDRAAEVAQSATPRAALEEVSEDATPAAVRDPVATPDRTRRPARRPNRDAETGEPGDCTATRSGTTTHP